MKIYESIYRMEPWGCETNLTQIVVPSLTIIILNDIHIHIKFNKLLLAKTVI